MKEVSAEGRRTQNTLEKIIQERIKGHVDFSKLFFNLQQLRCLQRVKRKDPPKEVKSGKLWDHKVLLVVSFLDARNKRYYCWNINSEHFRDKFSYEYVGRLDEKIHDDVASVEHPALEWRWASTRDHLPSHAQSVFCYMEGARELGYHDGKLKAATGNMKSLKWISFLFREVTIV